MELSAAAMRTKVRRALLCVFFKISDLIPNPPPLLPCDAGAKPQDHGPGRGRRITAAIICGRGNAAMAPGVMSPGATARPTQVRSRARFCTFFRSCLTPAPPPRLWRDAGARPQDHGRGRGRRVMAGTTGVRLILIFYSFYSPLFFFSFFFFSDYLFFH